MLPRIKGENNFKDGMFYTYSQNRKLYLYLYIYTGVDFIRQQFMDKNENKKGRQVYSQHVLLIEKMLIEYLMMFNMLLSIIHYKEVDCYKS